MRAPLEPPPLPASLCLALQNLYPTRRHKHDGLHQLQDWRKELKQMKRNDNVEDEKKEDYDDVAPSCTTSYLGASRLEFINSMNTCLVLSQHNETTSTQHIAECVKWFAAEVRRHTGGSSEAPTFDKNLRNLLEPYVSKARIQREQARTKLFPGSQESIASHSGIPYPSLRQERCFLYPVDMYPIHLALAELLGVNDLALLHEHAIQDTNALIEPLLNASSRQRFHECYDSFVTKFCIPFLHHLAMTNDVFLTSTPRTTSTKVNYRYQAFPHIQIVRPGDISVDYPHCDIVDGHSIGSLNFHIPLTPVYGTNALYTESGPGREDWHPLTSKSLGLGYLFDGARCLHFGLENTTPHTRVSIDFRIAIHREEERVPSMAQVVDQLCSKEILKDGYSQASGFYEEASIDVNSRQSAGCLVFKKHGSRLLHPDKRVGFPFTN